MLEVLNREEEAIQQLDKLAVIWPTEPNLYVSKGKVSYYSTEMTQRYVVECMCVHFFLDCHTTLCKSIRL